MEFKIKINPKGRIAYFPNGLFSILGTDIIAVPNCACVVLYNSNMAIKDVLASIDIIRFDLIHAQSMQQEKKTR